MSVGVNVNVKKKQENLCLKIKLNNSFDELVMKKSPVGKIAKKTV